MIECLLLGVKEGRGAGEAGRRSRDPGGAPVQTGERKGAQVLGGYPKNSDDYPNMRESS
jgi:hypothetical protein